MCFMKEMYESKLLVFLPRIVNWSKKCTFIYDDTDTAKGGWA